MIHSLHLTRKRWPFGCPQRRHPGELGKYIAVLDAGDGLYRECICLNVELFERKPDCGFVHGGYRCVSLDRTGHFVRTPNKDELTYLDLLPANEIGMPFTVLYRRDILIAVGAFEGLRTCEDWDVFLRIATYHRIAFHLAIIADYCRHWDSMSHNAERMFEGGIEVLRRQLARAGSGEGRRVAYRAGMERLRQLYVGRMLRQALADLQRKGRRKAALSQIALGLRFGAGFVWKTLARRLAHWPQEAGFMRLRS